MIGQVTHRAIELMSIELALLMAMRSNEEDKEVLKYSLIGLILYSFCLYSMEKKKEKKQENG